MTVVKRPLADSTNIVPVCDRKGESQHKRTASTEHSHRRTPTSQLQHKRTRINSLQSRPGSPLLHKNGANPSIDSCLSSSAMSNAFNGDSIAVDPELPSLNVVIPIGGIGSRFQKESFRFPKPLINIVGRPMLCWVMDRLALGKQDTVWLAINEAVDEEYRVEELIRKEFPKIDMRVLKLKYLTRGAAETVSLLF